MPLALGIVLATAGGASLALAMVTQRYALDPTAGVCPDDPDKVLLFGWPLARNLVWLIGIVLYGGANGFYAMSLLHGPLSLLAGCFTSLLLFNLLFARLLLGEALTPPKVTGAGVIMAGVVLCIVATPSEGQVETEFTPTQVEGLLARPAGTLYVSALAAAVVGSVAAISWFERRYPTTNAAPGGAGELDGEGGQGNSSGPQVKDAEAAAVMDEEEKEKKNGVDSTPTPTVAPPPCLDRVMAVVYPGSLGIDEGIAHLTMKASISMMDTCEGAGECWGSTMWVFLAVWTGSSVATLWWLRRVFTRYETTRALPVEYGAVNAVSACSGLVFYREAKGMADWQLGLLVAGVGTVLAGIGIGNLGPLDPPPGRAVNPVVVPPATPLLSSAGNPGARLLSSPSSSGVPTAALRPNPMTAVASHEDEASAGPFDFEEAGTKGCPGPL